MLAGRKCAELPKWHVQCFRNPQWGGKKPPPSTVCGSDIFVGHKLGEWVGNERDRAERNISLSPRLGVLNMVLEVCNTLEYKIP